MHTEELRLREACARGDLKAINNLLNAEGGGCMTSPFGRILLKQMMVKQRAPSLRCLYADDSCNFLVHYLAGAQVPPSRIDRLYEIVSKFLGLRPASTRTDRERATTIQTLVDQNKDLDFSLQNNKGQGVLHFCVLSDSIRVLRVILRATLAGKVAPEKLPVLDLPDQDGMTPLTLALEYRRFHCIRLLVAAGVLYQVQNDTGTPTRIQRTNSGRGGPSSRSSSLIRTMKSSLTELVGKTDQKLKELQKELDLSKNQEQELKSKVQVFSSLESLEDEYFTALDLLQSRLQVHQSIAQSHFLECSFNLQEALTSVPAPCPKSNDAKKEKKTCMVCFDDINVRNKCQVEMPCGHITCDTCWQGILSARLSEGDVHKTLILNTGQSKRFVRLLVSRYVDLNPALKWCPRHDCEFVVKLLSRLPKNSAFGVSCDCGESFCWSCSHDSHEPSTCEEAGEWRGAMDVVQTERKSTNWVKSETVRCPHCKSPIQREGGCNQITCSVCQRKFCYQCGEPWRGHVDHYVCAALGSNGSKKYHITAGVWSALEGFFHKVKESVTLSSYEWHLRQYLAHDLDPGQLRATAHYIANLLAATLPDEDLIASTRPDSSFRSLGSRTDFLHTAVEAVISAQKVLRNSYVLSFYLKKTSSRKKFLTRLQKQLETALDPLVSIPVLFPGFQQISSNTKTQKGAMQFTTDGVLFSSQFFYVHQVYERRSEIEQGTEMVCRSRDDILRAAKLNLLTSKITHVQSIPTSRTSS